MTQATFAPGFRLSVVDGVALGAGAVATATAAMTSGWIALGVAFAVAHFFLFCNVLRLPRRLELLWAGVFLMLMVAASAAWLNWPAAFGVVLLMTLGVAILGVRQPGYHGVLWRWFNPDLPDWWEARQAMSAIGVNDRGSDQRSAAKRQGAMTESPICDDEYHPVESEATNGFG